MLKLFTERQRNEVMVRIATLDGIQPTALRDLNEVMSKVLAGGDRSRKSSLGGVKTAAEIINMLGSAVETSVLDFVREADNDLAQKIMDNMFTFEDIEKIDDKGVQALMKEVQSESLVIALKGATPRCARRSQEHVDAGAETLREDLESRGPVRLSKSRPNEGNAEDHPSPGRRRADRDALVAVATSSSLTVCPQVAIVATPEGAVGHTPGRARFVGEA